MFEQLTANIRNSIAKLLNRCFMVYIIFFVYTRKEVFRMSSSLFLFIFPSIFWVSKRFLWWKKSINLRKEQVFLICALLVKLSYPSFNLWCILFYHPVLHKVENMGISVQLLTEIIWKELRAEQFQCKFSFTIMLWIQVADISILLIFKDNQYKMPTLPTLHIPRKLDCFSI